MTVLSHQSILRRMQYNIAPFVSTKVTANGKSYGLSHAGYDIRVNFKDDASGIIMTPGDFVLAVSLEHLNIPNDMLVFVKDKSSWAREGLSVQNTVLEPGWRGFITLELNYHRPHGSLRINAGDPIAQLIFMQLDEPTIKPYNGKYQDQINQPVEAKRE